MYGKPMSPRMVGKGITDHNEVSFVGKTHRLSIQCTDVMKEPLYCDGIPEFTSL